MGFFSLKSKPKENVNSAYAQRMRIDHQRLEDCAYQQYGSSYDALGDKEKNEVSLKVAEEK